MELSVVIPAHNEQDTIANQLSALLGQSWDSEWEIVVVDNASTDRTTEVVSALASENPRLRIVFEPTLGLCHARNAGIAAARGRSVAICDADDLVAPGWVAAMGNALLRYELVTGPEEITRLNPAWLAGSRGKYATSRMPYFHNIFPFPYGNNFGIRKSLFGDVGAFDQSFIGAEDVEFGLRAWLAGAELHFEPAALVHYAYRTTPRALWRQGLGYGRNRPAIVQQLLRAGRPRPKRLAGWKSWVWLALNAPRGISAEGRALLAWVAGNRIGHLVGSVRHRAILL